jgi:repressor LexA
MPPADQLTKRQQDVYEFIRDKIQNRGYGPTVREIGEAFAISSPNGVMCHLKALERKGLISRAPNMSRAISLAEHLNAEPTGKRRGGTSTSTRRGRPASSSPSAAEYSHETQGLPLAGCVAAGVLHEAVEQQERIDFGALFAKRNQFVLKVRGDSMIEAQIADGDYVVIKKQKVAAPGQMVVAQTDDGEATLKYWFPEKKRIRLQPANSSMAPIYVKDAQVLGVVVGVVRCLD